MDRKFAAIYAATSSETDNSPDVRDAVPIA